MFTKKHYIEVAKVLRKNKRHVNSALHLWWFGTVVQDFIELFKENSNFDKDVFTDAIYGKGDKT